MTLGVAREPPLHAAEAGARREPPERASGLPVASARQADAGDQSQVIVQTADRRDPGRRLICPGGQLRPCPRGQGEQRGEADDHGTSGRQRCGLQMTLLICNLSRSE